MKKIILSGLILCSLKGISQDTLKVTQIDLLVKVIDQYGIIPQTDSIVQDMPDLGLYMKTFVSIYFRGNDLVKYVDATNAIRQEKGETQITNTSSAFYFDKNKLIKVEETGNIKGKAVHAEWYYFNDKPLYYTMQSDKSESRAALLLTMAQSIQSKLQQGR
jgi:hypothetical protein